MTTYNVTVGMKLVRSTKDEKEAYGALYHFVKRAVEKGMAEMLLWEGTWIEVVKGKERTPIMFADARDYACKKGWIVDGEWQFD